VAPAVRWAALLKGKWDAWAVLVVAWADPPADKWVVPVVRWVALLKANWVDWAAPSVGWVVALPAVKRAAWATLVVAWPVLPAGKWAVWADPPVRWAVLPVGKWAA